MYYLILPLLVVVGIVLLSLLVVHGLVPLGQRLGFAFNEVARRHHRQAKAMKSLREAMDQMLGEAFPKASGIPAVAPTTNAPVTFFWVDLERSGAVQLAWPERRNVQAQQVHEALGQAHPHPPRRPTCTGRLAAIPDD